MVHEEVVWRPSDPSFAGEFQALLTAAQWRKARGRLQRAYSAEPDRQVRRWMREELLPSIDERRRAHAHRESRTRQMGAPKPSPVQTESTKCRRCGQSFDRPVTDAKRRDCDACRPPDQTSVRTVSGGAPSLGRRR